MYIVKVKFLSGNEKGFPYEDKDLAETFYKEMTKLCLALHVADVYFKEVKNV